MEGVTGCGRQQRQGDRALAWVARLIGLSEPTTPCLDHGDNDADSDAETEPIREESPSLIPSFIPETPLSGGEEAQSNETLIVALSDQKEDQETAARCSVMNNDAPEEGSGAVIEMEEEIVDGTEGMEIGGDDDDALRRSS
jgi:hypothetical protein